MGREKSTIVVNGLTLAARGARLLANVVEIAIEVGPGVSGLFSINEEPRGEGPLVAIEAGYRALNQRGFVGDVLVLACDLPRVSESLLRYLANYEAPGSVVPIVEGRAQPLCAKWSQVDLEATSDLVESGERSLRFLTTRPRVTLLDESRWSVAASEDQFLDVDTPDDLRSMGYD
jgi:molybdopterin-guanine dinucleotide biosynthesis protein A